MSQILLSTIMIIVMITITIFLSKKYKLNKRQILIFILLVLFWTSISTIRAYRKVFITTSQEFGGLGLNMVLAAQITAAYGLASFILRLPLFFLSDIISKRKIFIQISIMFIMISSILVFINPSYVTLYFSSLSMGICASILAIFNVMFSETFDNENTSVSVSILAVAPLLAEFIAAPIQYLFTFSVYKNYNFLWLSSAIISCITFVLCFYFKENEKSISKFSIEKVKYVIYKKNFLFICIIGMFISFIKFSSSGANMINYAQNQLKMEPLLIAYLDTVFSSFQLISSILVGTYFNKKYGLLKTLLISLICFLIFYFITIINKNPIILFISYSLIGFGYGGTYNTLIALAMQNFDKKYRNISMGIFQGFFSFGIFYGDRIFVTLNKVFKNSKTNLEIFYIASVITIICILIILSTILIEKRSKNEKFY